MTKTMKGLNVYTTPNFDPRSQVLLERRQGLMDAEVPRPLRGIDILDNLSFERISKHTVSYPENSCDPNNSGTGGRASSLSALYPLRKQYMSDANRSISLVQDQLRQLQAILETYWQDSERLRHEIHVTQELLAQTRQRNDELEAELDRVMRSRSLRLTRPLRGLRQIFRLGGGKNA